MPGISKCSVCNCCLSFSLSLLTTFSGWWFDACGPSNLNGMFYTAGQNHGKLNGIKWHYFKGPSYSLRSTTMMIRPLDFWKHNTRSNYKNNRAIQGSYRWETVWKLLKRTIWSPFQRQVVIMWCHRSSWLWIWRLLSSQKSLFGSLFSCGLTLENATHCHALKREELLSLLCFKLLLDLSLKLW